MHSIQIQYLEPNTLCDNTLSQLASVLSTLAQRTFEAGNAPWVYPQDHAFFASNLTGNALNILAYKGNDVVGYAALRSMQEWPVYLDSPNTLAEIVGAFPVPNQSAMLLYNLVDNNHRGAGIGKQLAQARIKLATQKGIKHLFSTVHPNNTPSQRILEQLGFRCILQKPMFTQQLPRKLFYLPLS